MDIIMKKKLIFKNSVFILREVLQNRKIILIFFH